MAVFIIMIVTNSVNPLRPDGMSPATAPRRVRIRNWRLIGLAFLTMLAGLGIFIARAPAFDAIPALGLALFSLWVLYSELHGLTVDDHVISMPTGRSDTIPLFSLGRRRIWLTDVNRLLVAPTWHGLQRVEIKGRFGSDLLLFQNRETRQRFIGALQERMPEIEVYRLRKA